MFQRHLGASENRRKGGGAEGLFQGQSLGPWIQFPALPKQRKMKGHTWGEKPLLSQESNSANQGSILCPLCPVLGTPT